jgi:hypothetical protein
MSSPRWVEQSPGVFVVVLAGADGTPVTLYKETWESKTWKHSGMDENWDALVETVEHAPSVWQSRRFPDRKVYFKNYAQIRRESGRVAGGTLMVVVEKIGGGLSRLLFQTSFILR